MLTSRNRTAGSRHLSRTLTSASPLRRWMFPTHFNSMEFCRRTRKRSFTPSTGPEVSHTTKNPHEHWIFQCPCGFRLWCEGGDLKPCFSTWHRLISGNRLQNDYRPGVPEFLPVTYASSWAVKRWFSLSRMCWYTRRVVVMSAWPRRCWATISGTPA